MKTLTLLLVSITLLATSCMKSNMPEPERTNTPCEEGYDGLPECDSRKEQKQALNARQA